MALPAAPDPALVDAFCTVDLELIRRLHPLAIEEMERSDYLQAFNCTLQLFRPGAGVGTHLYNFDNFIC